MTMQGPKITSSRRSKSLHPTSKVSSKDSNLSSKRPSMSIDEESHKEPPRMSRTEMLLIDYRHFKAARKIQTMVRGWMCRRVYRRKRCAAIIIQREWRRYFAQRNYYRILEQRVQDAIDEYHQNAAIRIQSYWRGFLVREHIHDQYRMKRSQRMAAEDLLHCIAYKLHYLLRTFQIPGIYSLRNSHALSKVEKLLISISFKQGNKRSLVSRLKREADQKNTKKLYQESAYGTKIPYSGPNFSGFCDPKCSDIYKEPNIDARMHEILRNYEAKTMKSHIKCRSKKVAKKILKLPKEPSDFCSDVVQSMRRWNILAPFKFTVRPDVFQNPENVAEFLSEIKCMYDFMYNKGHCKVELSSLVPECVKKI